MFKKISSSDKWNYNPTRKKISEKPKPSRAGVYINIHPDGHVDRFSHQGKGIQSKSRCIRNKLILREEKMKK